jgi:hypothetical protein
MKITNEKGMEVGDVIGPFDEGATLILVCIVTGGKKTNKKQFTVNLIRLFFQVVSTTPQSE